MKDIPVDEIRNFVLMGHTGSGKTSLVDNMLTKMGVVDEAGSTAKGTSVADWTEEERQHKISVWAKPFGGVYTASSGKRRRFVMTDTPGYADFSGQVYSAGAVSDAGLVVIDASAGIQVGTARAWKICKEYELPHGIAITGLDKENTSFDEIVNSIRDLWGESCVPVVLPNPDGKSETDVLNADPEDVPEEIAERVESIKTELVELAAETDDTLIEKYLEGEYLSAEEISQGLRCSVNDSHLVPIFAASPESGVGVTDMMDSISRLFPAPNDESVMDSDGNEIDTSEEAPFSGLVWRSVHDPFLGNLSFVRVYSGQLTPDTEIYNSSKGEKERMGNLLYVVGKKQKRVEVAKAGEMVAIAKLKKTAMNDSLCSVGHEIRFKPIELPGQVAAYAVHPKTKNDEEKMGEALHRAADDDHAIRIERSASTAETVMWGMGDMHLDVTLEHIKNRSNVEMTHSVPKIAYKETVTGQAKGHYKHKKQSGGHGQYGEVYLKIAPRPKDDEEWFADEIVGGVIPSNFIPAVEKGLKEGLQDGPMVGAEVINLKITLYDGSYHDVDSSEVAFKIAASHALHEAIVQANPKLLEPIMSVKVSIPNEYMGDINSTLNTKRGRIMGMEAEAGVDVIAADVPQAEMFRFCSELRSITSGQGSFAMEFSHYQPVPSHIAEKVIEAHQTEQ